MAHTHRRPQASRLEENEARLSGLQAALIEGERSGEPRPFDFDGFLTKKRKAATRRR
jgi:antitoxin ParD1/3/4